MNNSIFINFGKPKHGWLPVDFCYKGFLLDFAASDGLNDPIDELCDAIIKLQKEGVGQIVWWLEPGAYFFELTKNKQEITLTISETDDWNNENAEKVVVHKIRGSKDDIIEPLKIAIKHFCSKEYEEEHWPYIADKDKLKKLMEEV